MEIMFFAVLVIGFVIWYANSRKQTSDLVNQPAARTGQHDVTRRELAARYGWGFREEEPDYVGHWQGGPLGRGRDPQAREVLDGTYEGHPVTMFDYTYWVSGDRGSANRRQTHTVWVVRLPREVPYVELTPSGPVRSMFTDWVGVQDVQVGPEAFDDQFRIRTDDEAFVYAWLSYPVTQHMVNTGGYRVWTQGADLVCVEDGSASSTRLLEHLALMARLADRVPTA